MSRLLIRDVDIEGRRGLDVLIEHGRIAAIGPRLPHKGETIDGAGGALIPGLVDHHLHLFATAAQAATVDLSGCVDLTAVAARIDAARGRSETWVRATGCPAEIAEKLTRDVLDRIVPRNPLRILDRTGALWVLNSPALAIVGDGAALERDSRGRATGRVWRGDRWLRAAIGTTAPGFDVLGRQLASYGITGVTDASVTTDASSATALAEAHRSGALPQRLTLMSGGDLASPGAGIAVGAVKIVPDERDLPSLGDLVETIGRARAWERGVAVHCVTAVELALTLAAFTEAGTRPGDRIEHGGVVPEQAIPVLETLGLRVVTQPGFIATRGDGYRRQVAAEEQGDLYRCGTLIAGGVRVAGSSDAPYGPLDPWAAMRAAVSRRTAAGAMLGVAERVSPSVALCLYLGAQDDPGGMVRRVEIGAPADLCLLRVDSAYMLRELDAANVAATIVAGVVVWRR